MPAILQTLKDQFVQQFSAKGSVSLLVGLACNLAFIGQVYFWPALWHTSVFVVSYTDASYVGQLACSLVLIAYFKKTNRLSLNAWVLWVSAILAQCILILYYILEHHVLGYFRLVCHLVVLGARRLKDLCLHGDFSYYCYSNFVVQAQRNSA